MSRSNDSDWVKSDLSFKTLSPCLQQEIVSQQLNPDLCTKPSEEQVLFFLFFFTRPDAFNPFYVFQSQFTHRQLEMSRIQKLNSHKCTSNNQFLRVYLNVSSCSCFAHRHIICKDLGLSIFCALFLVSFYCFFIPCVSLVSLFSSIQ